MNSPLNIRTEVFEHGVFPLPPKLGILNIVSLFNSLSLASNIDNKVTLEQFKESISKYIPSISPKDAEAYFILFKVIVDEDLSFLTKFSQSTGQSSKISSSKTSTTSSNNQIVADSRALTIFIFLQTFSTALRHNVDMKQKEFNAAWGPNPGYQFNECIRGNLSNPHFSSPINSPRSKTTRIAFTNEYNQMIIFLKNNLKQVLKFLSVDLNSDENVLSTLSENEFNLLKFIFAPEKAEASKLALSKYSGLYSTTPKVSINMLTDWLSGAINPGDANDVMYIQGLNKIVTIKEKSVCQGKEIRIIACEDSYIYIDACVKYISIVNCVNTTVFVASVKKVCTIDKCENLTLTIATNFLRIGNTIDSTINYYGSFPPVLYGDNRSIVIGPYNANYVDLIDRIKEADIAISYKNIQNYDSPLVLNDTDSSNINHKIQKIEDFSTLILPENFKTISPSNVKNYEPLIFGTNENKENDLSYLNGTNCVLPILCPNTFRDNLKMRYRKYVDVQNDLKTIGLSEEEQSLLHFSMQSYFKDWLVHTGSIKPILDMAKMIDKE